MSLRTAVLVSGSGRSLENLLELERRHELPTKTVLVVSSKAEVRALEVAQRFSVPARILSSAEITEALDAAKVDLVILAGYLKRWPLPERYIGKTINIHPSLLPLFGGKGFFGHHVHEAVIRSGMRVTGCTVHFVTANYDEGPIIAQHAVPVLSNDTPLTLAARVFEQEKLLLPEVIRMFASQEFELRDGAVVFRA